MKKLIILIVLIFNLNSCESSFKAEKYEITKIDVFYIPFGVLAPTQSDENSIRKLKSYQLENVSEIENIKKELKSLSKSDYGKKFNENSIYLVCDFFTKDGKAFTLMFDKNHIEIEGKTYDNNERLINSLIEKGGKGSN